MKQRMRQRRSAYLAETDCDQSEVAVPGFFSLGGPLTLAILRSPLGVALLASMSAGDAMPSCYIIEACAVASNQ